MVNFRSHHHLFFERETHEHAPGNFSLDDKPRPDKKTFVVGREGISYVKSRHKTDRPIQRRRQPRALPARLSSPNRIEGLAARVTPTFGHLSFFGLAGGGSFTRAQNM